MEFFTRNIRRVGSYSILIILMCILAGCTKDSSNTAKELVKNKKELDLHEDMGISIFDEQVEEAETNIYYITSYHAPTGETYPQIVLKGNKDNEEGGLLYSCRGTGWPNYFGYAECRISKDDIESFDMCEAIKDFDFSVQEYPINTILYTAEVEQEFKYAFYETISNRVPIEYTEDGAIYFREWFRGVANESDSEFLEGLRKSKYRFIDMDGDGLPELAMQFGWEICILQYDVEEKRVKEYFGPAEGWVLLGSDRFGIHDTGSPGLERNEYRFLGGRNEVKQIFYFERDTMYETLCTVTASGKIEGGAVVSEDKWEELTLSFIDSMKHPIEFFSFEETFGEVSDGQLASARDVEDAQRAFSEFLAGERNAGNVAVKDIVETSGGEAKYLVFDVSGDGVPELHIQSNKAYYIFSYQQNRLFVWFKEYDHYGSSGHYDVLESGEVVRSIYQDDREYYLYWRIQPSAEVIVDFSFGRVDTNGDGIYDRSDVYEFDMRTMEERYAGLKSEQNITMEEWLDLLKNYLYIDENGRVQLLGRLEWADL